MSDREHNSRSPVRRSRGETNGSSKRRRTHDRKRSGDSRSRSRSRSYSPKGHSSSLHRRKHSRRSRSGSANHRRPRYSRSKSRSYSPYPPASRNRRSRSGSRKNLVPAEGPPPNRCLGVFGMSLYTDEKQLETQFGQFGKIDTIQIVYDKQTGRSRGFGFIYFDKVDDAARAKENCAGTEIDGHRIRVDFSITKRPHTPTPGVYMGKRNMRRDDFYHGGKGGRSPSPYYPRRRSHSRSYS